jgi:DNA-binding transcriptional ArsR family regulator
MITTARNHQESDRDANALFKAIADPSRRKILSLLEKRDLSLMEIESEFAMSRPAVIKHVRLLKACGLVEVRRDGRESIHHLNPGPLRGVRDWVEHFDIFWDKRLQRLKRQVENDK